jgi:hypothetical protein
MGFGDVNHKRLPRSTRHLIRSMQKIGTASHRAASLRAHVSALDYSLRVSTHPNERLPSEPGDAPGLRVRLGRDTRDILRRLAASRNRLVQMALVKELRHAVARRIEIHRKRQERAQRLRQRAQGARTMAAAWRSSASARTRAGWERARVPSRAPVPAGGPTPLASVPDRAKRARTSRARTSRTPRDRVDRTTRKR